MFWGLWDRWTLGLGGAPRAPAGEDESFYDDIERIAARFLVDANMLAEATRLGQSIFYMAAGDQKSATLLAARDADVEPRVDEKKEDRP